MSVLAMLKGYLGGNQAGGALLGDEKDGLLEGARKDDKKK